MPGVSVWHPFWLPKLVLDGVEEKKRGKLRALSEAARVSGEELRWSDEKGRTPLWARDNEWGNDGLVTVQSAKWGKFLGIMEGCDREFFPSPFGVLLTDCVYVRLGNERSTGDRVWCRLAGIARDWKRRQC
jgi:hypothetical protein